MTGEPPEYWWAQLTQTPPERPQGVDVLPQDAADVVVVGAGVAGYTAAILAAERGCSVLMLDAAERGGGTTFKSGGGYWIPNNARLRERGGREDRGATLRYMASLSFPRRYDARRPYLGLDPRDYELLEVYYDAAAQAVDALEACGALRSRVFQSFTEEHPGMVSYHSDRAEEFLRHLAPAGPDGAQEIGSGLITQLAEAARERGIPLVTRHRVVDVVTDDDAVVGVVARTPGGDVTVHARRGVVFASGGFSHDVELVDRVFAGPIYGTGAVATNRGDLVGIAERLGAELGNMPHGWLAEVALELALQEREQPNLIFMPSGDSMIYVDVHGRRVVNEKQIYQERTAVHFVRDERGGFPNSLLFMIFDDAVAQDPRPWSNPWPAGCADEPYVISAPTLSELASRVDERLARLEPHTGGVRLAAGFAEDLIASVRRFDRFAAQGRDEDFARGETLHELDWNRRARPGHTGNPTMHAFSAEGPYHCVIVAAATLDTDGGPRVNADAQVVRRNGTPIPGLYAAGNCMASPAGEGYWSGGSTIGPAMTFGYLAARAVAAAPVREAPAASGAPG